MTPNPTHGTPSTDATLAIRRLARRTGGDVQELQTLYLLEALLARIARSEHHADFVLKGGVLLAAFGARRPTKDIDLLATGIRNDVHEVAARVREVAAIELPDGVVFDLDSIDATSTRTGVADRYPGVRIRLLGTLGTARVVIGVDVNFGDPIWPSPRPTTIPPIIPLGQTPVTVLGYPLTMVLAEKIVTIVDRGEGNTRWRDFADVYTLMRRHPAPIEELRTAVEVVAAHRSVGLVPLLPRLGTMPARAQPRWLVWRARTNRSQDLPEQFDDLLTTVANLIDPILAQTRNGD